MLVRIVLPALVLVCAVAAPVAVKAEPVSRTVSYADLDLTTESGRKALDKRLERAARRLCGFTGSTGDLHRLRDRHLCLAEARSSYRVQVELALDAANARRVAVLADKIALLSRF